MYSTLPLVPNVGDPRGHTVIYTYIFPDGRLLYFCLDDESTRLCSRANLSLKYMCFESDVCERSTIKEAPYLGHH